MLVYIFHPTAHVLATGPIVSWRFVSILELSDLLITGPFQSCIFSLSSVDRIYTFFDTVSAVSRFVCR